MALFIFNWSPVALSKDSNVSYKEINRFLFCTVRTLTVSIYVANQCKTTAVHCGSSAVSKYSNNKMLLLYKKTDKEADYVRISSLIA